MGLPRARIAPYAKRYRVRRRLVDLAYQAMVYEAQQALTEDTASWPAKNCEKRFVCVLSGRQLVSGFGACSLVE